MAKISLSIAVNLDITDSGKVVKTFNLTYRQPSKKEQKQLGKENETILDLFKQSQKIDRRIEAVEVKIEALRSMENKASELLKSANLLEKLYIQKDEIEDDFEKIGGIDKMLEASKETFSISVGGKDKDELMEFIEENSDYSTFLDAIAEDAKKQKGN